VPRVPANNETVQVSVSVCFNQCYARAQLPQAINTPHI
jgi:hypothetical protein